MNNKRPYDDLLKNLFHEQAAEVVSLLLPDFHVEEVFDIEMPDLKSVPLERSPTPLEEGIVGLAIPEAKVVQVYRTEWIEHSGHFERAYRVTNSETTKPCFLTVEVQTEQEKDNHLASRLLANFVSIDRHIRDDILKVDYAGNPLIKSEEEDIRADTSTFEPEKIIKDFFAVELKSAAEDKSDDEAGDDETNDEAGDDETNDEDDLFGHEGKGTIMNPDHDNYPFALCPFPNHVPQPIRNEFMGRVMLAFNFKTINLWEQDAREFLNNHAYPVYYLLPTMKNADALLLKLAIAELVQHFQGNQPELARHLTGLSLMLQRSETITEEERIAALQHLQPFAHLLDETLI